MDWPSLRARVLADPTLQGRLRQEQTQAGLEEALGGIDLTEPLRAARRRHIERALPGPLGPPDNFDTEGWTPVALLHGEADPQILWRDLRGLDPNDDAFMADTLGRALGEPYRVLMDPCTGLDALRGTPVMAGLILHASRCGSTLACRMLAVDASLVVVSEPEALDGLLSLPAPAADRARWVRGLLAALGRPGRRLVVKADAWSVLEADVLRAAVPEVPWAFLTRDPAAIIASHMREPGSHMIPGAFGVPVDPSRERHCALVLRRIFEAARAALDDRALVIDHADLPAAAVDRLCPHFGVTADAERMLAAAVADAKRPYERHDPTREREERPLTAEIIEAARTVPAL